MKDQSDHSKPQKRQTNRTRRYIFLTIVLLVLGLAATQAFLHQTSVGNPRFIRMIFLLYTGTTIVVLAIIILAAILGRNLVKLYFEKKSGKAGSRFRTRIVRIFIVLSLLPAVLLFLLSYGLISSQIDQWFQAPLVSMMEHSRLLAESYYNEAERSGKYFATNIAGYVQVTESFQGGGQDALQQKLKEFLHQYNVDCIQVFSGSESLFAGAGSSPAATEEHRESVMRLVRETVEERKSKFQVTRLDPMDPYREISWATAPVYDTESHVVGVVLTETLSDQSAGYSSGEVLQAYEKYEQLQEEKNTLRFNTVMILGLSTLLIVFAFSWVALFLAKKITVPIQALELELRRWLREIWPIASGVRRSTSLPD
ncbi:MAG: hypothetical protein P8Z37_02465 [Acidobacteriota bacterium]